MVDYSSWLTSSLEAELHRLIEELRRNQTRYNAFLLEWNRKWARLRYRIRRVRQIEAQVRQLEERARRARTRPQQTRLREALADVRASITPQAARREATIADINFERTTYKVPLENRIRYLKERIRTIAEELERRRRKPERELVHVKVIVFTTVRGQRARPRKYHKRLQAFYNVDAIRNKRTGEFDYTQKLTVKELDIAVDYFYSWWNWATLPYGAEPPRWIESGEWEPIDEPRGLDVKQLSVRKEGEEVYSKHYRPPDVLYRPSKAEAEELKNALWA